MSMDIKELTKYAARFRKKVAEAKRNLGEVDFEWYAYDTLSNIGHLDRLLTGSNRLLLGDRKQRILDIGCQDGEMSFLLESLGHEVVAIDHSAYSYNGMRGVRALKAALGSSIELHEVDLDRQFSLPHDSYDLAVFFGVLYHLRNPFYVLEEIARRASSCFLSTRVARYFPDGTRMPANASLAYLLDAGELNQDNTNYFIFSEAGLRVMLTRTHWTVCESMSMGNVSASDPVRVDRDERFFCLLKSRCERLSDVELLEGWHESEGNGWRWTRQEFAARIQWNEPIPPRQLTVQLYVAERLLAQRNPLRVALSVNDRPLPPEVYQDPGPHELVRMLGPSEGSAFELRVSLDGAMPPDDDDRRERGLIINSIRLE